MAKKYGKKKAKKNALLAKERGYDRHYYLEKLGLKLEDCMTNFCDNTDKRYDDWMKEREVYGFDSRETWCLENIFYQWMYEHLKMFKKRASKIVNLEYHKFNVNGEEMTQLQAINRMIELLEKIVSSKDSIFEGNNWDEERRELLAIWAEVLPAMWW